MVDLWAPSSHPLAELWAMQWAEKWAMQWVKLWAKKQSGD